MLLRVSRRRWEPWRDWAVIAVLTHLSLLVVVLTRPTLWEAPVAALPFAVMLAVGTLTVLHDAGHRMYSAREWPNVVAVHLATPAGLWVRHWTHKHRIHHKSSQVFGADEATQSSSLVRLHPAAASKPWQRYQHLYAWLAYSLAWLGEFRSQTRYLSTGLVSGQPGGSTRGRIVSFVVEKLLAVAVLAPYVALLGFWRFVVVLVVGEAVASVLAAVVLVVGHINEGLEPVTLADPVPWATNLVRTTANFSTANPLMFWFSGGLTHHLAHHLRPVALRSELPHLTETVVRDVVTKSGYPLSEYPSLASAVAGHYRRLAELGRPAPVEVLEERKVGELTA